MPPVTPTVTPLPRMFLRLFAVTAVCGLLQALLPRYAMGSTDVAPLSLALGVAAAAAVTRGRTALAAAVLGVLLGEWWRGAGLPHAVAEAAITGAQAGLVALWLRRSADAEMLALDTWPRLKRLVLQAAPAAAVLGALAHAATDAWLLTEASPTPLVSHGLVSAFGRIVADGGGIVVAAAIVLCWLARPAEPWRPRRRMLALPLLLLVPAVLFGVDEVARRDEARLQVRFQGSAADRLWRVQQALNQPLDALAAVHGALAAAESAGKPPLAAVFDPLAAGWSRRMGGLLAAGWAEGAANKGELAASHVFTSSGKPLAMPGQLPDAWQRQLTRAWGAADRPVLLPVEGNDTDMLLARALTTAPGAPPRLVFLVVRLDALLASALPRIGDPNVVACVIDRTADQGSARSSLASEGAIAGTRGTTLLDPVGVRRAAGPVRCHAGGLGALSRMASETVLLGERPLRLVVAEPATADDRVLTAAWLLGLPAVLGTAMLATLLLALSGKLRRIEDRVHERTAALQTEIEERRQTEAALAHSEQRFRAIFDAVNIGVTLVDTDGQLVTVNPAFCTMMGGTAEDLVGHPLAEFRLPDVEEDDGMALAVAVGGAQAHRQRYMTVDGRLLHVAASLRNLTDATGEPVATVGALQDLTPMLRLREAEREREQAQTANRTKSEFLARLSEELRTPLNAIVGFAQMLGDKVSAGTDLKDRAAHQRGLDQIRRAGWHLLDMVNNVLDLSRMEAGSLRLTLEPASLPEVVQQALAQVEATAQRSGVRLLVSLSPAAERVQADPARLAQVLGNLLSNAVKYNHRGGRVELRARPGGMGDVLIEVHDTGVGIPAEQMDQLFTPFHRLGRDALGLQGTGIGLVISRRLAMLMNGELSVASTPGEGSVFSLRLPRAEGPPQRVEVSGAAPLASDVSIGTVLYIEDRESDIAVMRGLLAQRPGVTLRCARSAAEGLQLAPDADLVLLDLDLPDRPGLALLRELRADTRVRRTTVVVVSGDSHPARIDECFDAGATAYLTKPLDPKRLLRTIDEGLKPL